MNERLHRASSSNFFEDQKDTIKLTTIISKVVDKETQEKIDVVKSRLIKNFGYCEICATDALNFVASIFAKSIRRVTSLFAIYGRKNGSPDKKRSLQV